MHSYLEACIHTLIFRVELVLFRQTPSNLRQKGKANQLVAAAVLDISIIDNIIYSVQQYALI